MLTIIVVIAVVINSRTFCFYYSDSYYRYYYDSPFFGECSSILLTLSDWLPGISTSEHLMVSPQHKMP